MYIQKLIEVTVNVRFNISRKINNAELAITNSSDRGIFIERFHSRDQHLC